MACVSLSYKYIQAGPELVLIPMTAIGYPLHCHTTANDALIEWQLHLFHVSALNFHTVNQPSCLEIPGDLVVS